jgi:protein TonB
MKNVKKLPTKQLEKFSTIFTQLGLVLVLFIVYLTLEHQTLQKQFTHVAQSPPERTFIEPFQDIVFVKEEIPESKPAVVKTPQLILDEPIKKGDNKVTETIIDTEPVEKVPVLINNLPEVVIPEEIIEDVPYDFIQEAPVFKGCEGLSKEENKICFDKQMKRFVQRNFDLNLASKLGLNSGIYKIHTQFIIDNLGNVVDIKIRAPHSRLKSEALNTIQKLPQFKPGKQNNKFVKVRYNLPITFKVD